MNLHSKVKTILKKAILLITILYFSNCSTDKTQADTSLPIICKTVQTISVRSDKNELGTFLSNPCDTFSIEFEGLYPVMDTLPNSADDSLLTDNYLKRAGFMVNSSGQGNWEGGPRMMVLELIKGSCKCTVFKKYYYNDTLKDGTYNLRVTEKVVCNAGNNAVD